MSTQPAISLLLFLILKIIRWRWRGSGGWVELGDWNKLHGTLDKLDELVMRRNATLGDAPTSPVSVKPSLDETGNGQPFSPAFSGRYPGHSSVGSDDISPPPQDYPNSQRRQDRMSIPLSEIGPGDNEPIGDQRGYSSVSPDARTTPFNPQAAYFPPQATHYALQTTNETPQSAYYTPQSTTQYPPPAQQYPYQPYQPYQPVDASPPSQNQSIQHDQYGQSGQNDQSGQRGQYGHY
jgi:hypothetical protein